VTSRRTRRASVLPAPTKPAPPKCTSTASTRQKSQVEVQLRLFNEPKMSLLLFLQIANTNTSGMRSVYYLQNTFIILFHLMTN
jgi:hypothetical protein